ncbi:MFS transporter [Companilactobacillus versmoldensis]|uniref:MFS transporter n=1 Tax=Companilactobacillus versmoldensis TaxID=194326 RepID=UPI00024917D4|nr:MFS transporter [Companilactobacillus versmoldensis]
MNTKISTRVKLSILAVGLLTFVGVLVETSMNVTFPELKQELHVSLGTIQWLTTGYLLLTTIVMSTTAYILKKFDSKKVFMFAATLCFIGTLVCLSAVSFPILLIGRLIQAISTGLATPLMFNLIFTEIPSSRLGVYTGLASVIISLAPALGPTYGGLVNDIWSWRAIFVGVIPIILFLGILGWFTVRGKAIGTDGIKFDYWSVIGLAIIFFMILFTFDQAGTNGWLSPQFGLWIIASIIIILIFRYYNRRSKRQMIDFSILELPILRLRLFGYFSLQFINIGLSFVLPIFAQTVLSANSSQAGLMLLPGSLIGAMVGPYAGYLYDKKGPTVTLLISGILITLGSLSFVLVGANLTVITIGIIYTIVRMGFNFGFSTSLSDGSVQVTGSKKSDQNSLFSMMQQYAGSLGTNVLSVVISAAAITTGTNNSVINTLLGAKIDFVILTILSALVLCSIIYVYFKYSKNNEAEKS